MKNTIRLLLTLAAITSGTIGARTARADAYSNKILSHGPIAYWRMNEGGGKKARDIVGGHTADYDETYNSPSFRQPGGVKDSNDRSTGFTGGKLWSAVPYDPALNPSGAFTVSFLVNLNQRYHDWSKGGYWHTAANTWHAWRDPGSRNGWSYEGFFIGNYPPNQRWYFYLGSWRASTAQPYGYNVITGGRTTPGRWDHVTCTFTPDGGTNEHGMPTGTMALYSNGALVSSLAGRAHGPNTVMPFVIGAHGTAHPNRTPYWQHTLDGDLDELAVFNKALSAAEIQELVVLTKVYEELTYYVRKTGSNSNDGLTPETAFASFQHAASQCRAGDTVYVGAGEYNYTGNYRFYGTGLEGLPIRFIADKTGEHTGDAGDVVMSGTITKWETANGTPRCSGNWPFYTYNADDLHFRGFKFKESYCPLRFHNSERTVIDDCEFTDHGYAIYHPGGSATITNVDVHDNTYYGILCYYGSYTVTDAKITNPGSYGLYFYQQRGHESTPSNYCKAERVEIRGTRSWALMGYYGTVDLTDCVFEDNAAGVYLMAYHANADWHPSHKVKNLTMRRTRNWALMGYYCEMDLEESTFEDNKYGVYLRGNYPYADLPSTYNLNNLTIRGTEGSWGLSVYNGETTLRDSTFENNYHGAAISDHATHRDINRLNCVAENLTFKDHKGWALSISGLDAEVRDITSENNRYSIQFADKRRTSGSDNRCKFTAERIRNTGSRYYGLLSYRSDLTLTDSQFNDNTHGLYLFEDANAVGTGAQAYLDRVEICRNKNSWAVLNYRTDIDMRNSLVADNRYGIYLYDVDKGSQLWHVTSVNNWAHGIYQYLGEVDVYNCISTGAQAGYGLISYRGTMNNDHNLVLGNYRNYYSAGPTPGLGAVYGIPMFAGDDDYHLMDTSPGVNGGLDPGDLCEHDLENYDRGQNGGWNVGCYATTAPGWEYDDLPHAYSQNNPISWWRLGEKVDEETAVDIIGNNHGTYMNGVQRAAVSPVSTDGCAFFSTKNHHIRVPHHEKYMIDDGTVLMWYRVKSMPSSWTGFFSKNKPGLSAGEVTFWMLKPYNGRPYLYHEAANRYWVLHSGEPGTLGEWTFLAYTFGSAGVATYENGAMVLHYYQEKSGWNATDSSPGNREPIYIGGTTWRQHDTVDPYWPFVGWIDEVAIFDRQLSSSEIARIYRAALNPKKDPRDMQIPPIWGVTGTDGRLFRIDDYTDPGNTSTDFGQIKWQNGSSVEPIGTSIDSIAADGDGTAYLLVNKSLGSHAAPLVMRAVLQDAESGEELIASPMSTIDITGGVNDVAVDPGSGLLYALGANGRLYSVDPVKGEVTTDFGDLKNDKQGLDVEGGKSLMFDQLGGLYVLDAYDNHLYRVDKNTALIRRVPDYKYGGGLEASAWDHLNNRAVASNTSNNTLRHLTLIPGNNPSFGSFGGTGLSNVTGLSFVPNEGRGNAAGGWRMTDWIEIR